MSFGGFSVEFTEELTIQVVLPEHEPLAQRPGEANEEFDARCDKDWEQYKEEFEKKRESELKKSSEKQLADDVDVLRKSSGKRARELLRSLDLDLDTKPVSPRTLTVKTTTTTTSTSVISITKTN
jgi:hypothetical protein